MSYKNNFKLIVMGSIKDGVVPRFFLERYVSSQEEGVPDANHELYVPEKESAYRFSNEWTDGLWPKARYHELVDFDIGLNK